MEPITKVSKEDLQAAKGRFVPDLIAPGLNVLFCGINPGLYSAAVSYHFARPGNRFWPTLHTSGFTPRLLKPFEEKKLLDLGYGITNLVKRATARADELNAGELVDGMKNLTRKVKRYAPKFVAVLGISAYRTAFHCPAAKIGLQEEKLYDSKVWVLPSPSGLNAHFKPSDLSAVFKELFINAHT